MVNFATGVTINSKSHNSKPIDMKNQEPKTNLFEMELQKYKDVNSEQKVPKYMWNLYKSQLHTPSSCATRSYIVYKNNGGLLFKRNTLYLSQKGKNITYSIGVIACRQSFAV